MTFHVAFEDSFTVCCGHFTASIARRITKCGICYGISVCPSVCLSHS